MATQTSYDRRGDRLAHRLTTESESELNELSDEQRLKLAGIWLARAAHEQRAGAAFERVVEALNELGASPALAAFALQARADERRHSELACAVASYCAGHQLELPPPSTPALPGLARVPPRQAAVLQILGHTLVGETFASAILESSLRLATGRLARSALVELLSDELDHAPIGWTYLASSTAAERQDFAPFLHGLIAVELAHWRASATPVSDDPALLRHGAPTRESLERALFRAVRETILPGLASFGLPTHEIWSWLRRGASTRPEALRAVAIFPMTACRTECDEYFDLR